MKEMLALAKEAVEAAKVWKLDLDYSAESLEGLEWLAEKIFRSNRLFSLPEDILVSMANVYGAYLGVVLLRSGLADLDFAWVKNEEGEIGVGKEDFLMYPVTKFYKRITRGPEHNLTDFFECMFGLAIGAVDLNDPRMHMLSEKEVS